MAIVLSENFRAVFYAPFYAAQATGAFEHEGVVVQFRPSASPNDAAQALRSGAADVMWGGPLRVLTRHNDDPNSDLICFCSVVGRDPFFVIGREPRPNFRIADLSSVRLATVSEVPTPWLCLQQDIRDAGIDPATVDRASGGTMADNAEALRAGTIDAVQLFQPYAESLLADGAGHLWYAQAARGPTAYTSFITRRDTLHSKRDEFLRMTRAVARTLTWIAQTPGNEVQRVVAEFFTHVPAGILAACIDRYRALHLWDDTPVLQRQGFERLRASMLSGGAITHGASFEACVDNELAHEAIGG